MRLLKIAAVAAFMALSLQAVATAKIPNGSASDSQGGAVPPTPFSTNVDQLSYHQKVFSGRLKSGFSKNDVPDYVQEEGDVLAKANECTVGRKAKLFREASGEDVLINDGKTNNNGVFAIDGKKQKNKKYYVSVPEHEFLWWEYYNPQTGTTIMTYGLCEKVKGNF